jgi:hypothetical protein
LSTVQQSANHSHSYQLLLPKKYKVCRKTSRWVTDTKSTDFRLTQAKTWYQYQSISLSSVQMPETECRWRCGADINIHQEFCPSGLWCKVTFQKTGIIDYTSKINALWRIKKNITNNKSSGNVYFLCGILMQTIFLGTRRFHQKKVYSWLWWKKFCTTATKYKLHTVSLKCFWERIIIDCSKVKWCQIMTILCFRIKWQENTQI